MVFDMYHLEEKYALNLEVQIFRTSELQYVWHSPFLEEASWWRMRLLVGYVGHWHPAAHPLAILHSLLALDREFQMRLHKIALQRFLIPAQDFTPPDLKPLCCIQENAQHLMQYSY